MSKSPSLASFLLLALLINIFPAQRAAASTRRQSEQGRRGIKLKPSIPTPDKKRPVRPAPAGATDASDAQSSKSEAMRLVVQLGLGAFVYGFAAFSSDSRLVATGASGDVVIWDVGTGREVRRLSGNAGEPGAQDIDGLLWGSFSPDARLFATGAGPNLRLWNIASGKLLWKRSNPANAIFGPEGDTPPVSFTPDGGQIIVKGTTDKLTWDAATGKLVSRARFRKPVDGYTDAVPRAAFSAGKLSAKAAGGVVALADKATRKEMRRIRFKEIEGAEESDDGLLALALAPDDRMLLTVNRVGENEHSIRLWDARTGDALRELGGAQGESADFHFKPSGGLLGVTHEGRTVRAREMSSGRLITWVIGGERDIEWLDVSPDGRFVVTAAGRTGQVWDAETGTQLARVEPEVKEEASTDDEEESEQKAAKKKPAQEKKAADDFSWDFAGFTPEETITFFKDGVPGETLDRIVLSTKDWKERRMPNGTQTMPYTVEHGVINHGYVMNARAAAWETGPFEGDPANTTWLTVWSADPKTKNKRFQIDTDEAYNDPSYFTLSPDGRKALVATSNAGGNLTHTSIKVWDADQKRALFRLAAPGFRAYALAWSPDGRTLATGADDGTTVLWDASNGKQLRRLAGQRDAVGTVEFSPDSRLLLTACADGFTRVFDVATGAELCRFITFGDGNWVVVAPDGRFDTSNLDEIKGVHWIAPDDPLKPLPLEIFMRDYYEPRLLTRLLSGEKLPPARSLAQLNRAQPVVAITSVEQHKERPELVNVTIEVSKAKGDTAQGALASASESGVHDLRLFRDGQLVGYSPSEGGEVKTDAGDGKATITFNDIKLPRRADSSEVELTAYAFNEDRVKSLTARQTYRPQVRPQAMKGRAYVISVGVNAYENESWDLRFAANDARRLQEVVAERIARAGEHEEIVRVPLVSDYELKEGRKSQPRVITEMTATKANFKAVLDALAGKTFDKEALKKIPNADKLRQATPEDLVIISFSSHGYADERGTFYLLASDTGAGAEMRDALSRAISSDELSLWLRDVDAGELVMVVDACHSAASVQGEGFKPGPMGSRGLGQLSYDKGMRILTSTQADNVALESGLIEQGLLTYALTHDGIESGRADFRPRNREITVAEWLAYGVERVPALYAEVELRLAEINAGRAKVGDGLGGDSQAKVVVFAARDVAAGAPGGSKGLAVSIPVSGETTKTQQPALFDFARRRREALLAKTQ
ncbi:MAG: caspase family protein [Rubrivivax sp.]|nr:caspase family protein [Pyrinomonadaceae bacterium]